MLKVFCLCVDCKSVSLHKCVDIIKNESGSLLMLLESS